MGHSRGQSRRPWRVVSGPAPRPVLPPREGTCSARLALGPDGAASACAGAQTGRLTAPSRFVSTQRPEHEQPHGAAAWPLPPPALPGGAVSRGLRGLGQGFGTLAAVGAWAPRGGLRGRGPGAVPESGELSGPRGSSESQAGWNHMVQGSETWPVSSRPAPACSFPGCLLLSLGSFWTRSLVSSDQPPPSPAGSSPRCPSPPPPPTPRAAAPGFTHSCRPLPPPD